jgi:acrylyl-CoA reductase (NADPH)
MRPIRRFLLRALVTRQDNAGAVASAVEDSAEGELPEGDVLVAVEWSSLNFKDALCLKGQGNLVKSYPHVAGVDLAGRVVESRSSKFHPGQAVILTGWRVGELRWGGYAQRARVQSEWLVPLPRKLSTRDAMVLGTAGLTAMLAINRLKGEGISADRGKVLVTGAGGGVGSLAVLLLSRLGYRVSAVTGRPEVGEQLRRLGAAEILTREEFAPSAKVLDKERFAAAIDNVGGPMLASLLKQIAYGGAVASIGAAATPEWSGSVIPFILRAVSILGIDSVMAPLEARYAAWDRLADLYSPAYAGLVTEARLEDLPALADRILRGDIAGRVVVSPRDPPS